MFKRYQKLVDCFGGQETQSPNKYVIDYITIATEGNAQDFGDTQLTMDRLSGGSCASTVRGVFSGGQIHQK